MANGAGAVTSQELADRGQQYWDRYQRDHDVSGYRGQVAAVDPESGSVWFGEEVIDAVRNMNADGVNVPVYLIRVGYGYLDVKDRH